MIGQAHHVAHRREVPGHALVPVEASQVVDDEAAVGRGREMAREVVGRGRAAEDRGDRARCPGELGELVVDRREDDGDPLGAKVPQLRERGARLPDVEHVRDVVAPHVRERVRRNSHPAGMPSVSNIVLPT